MAATNVTQGAFYHHFENKDALGYAVIDEVVATFPRHRSVVVNISAVEEIQPLPTGDYGLRVTGGKEYLVTPTYKDNLRDLAQPWVGSDRIPG